ncbi:ATP-dependent zinc protease [Aestuariibius sp. 2305UL40-4]|uniref:ATP-dependent zinc protease family protein n=1 Tax=Aestuariibius violaceus TaxID=3234132 RepID=UPI00345E7BFB
MNDAKDQKPKPARELTVIGWMEMIDLPDLGLEDLKTKIDTGARTSALHATDIRTFTRDGAPWIAFMADSGHGLCDRPIEAPIHEQREIKNTSGIPEERYIIRTKMGLGKRRWTIDLSLSDRTNMTFPMIVGRAALKNHAIAVHTRRAYLVTDRPEKT